MLESTTMRTWLLLIPLALLIAGLTRWSRLSAPNSAEVAPSEGTQQRFDSTNLEDWQRTETRSAGDVDAQPISFETSVHPRKLHLTPPLADNFADPKPISYRTVRVLVVDSHETPQANYPLRITYLSTGSLTQSDKPDKSSPKELKTQSSGIATVQVASGPSGYTSDGPGSLLIESGQGWSAQQQVITPPPPDGTLIRFVVPTMGQVTIVPNYPVLPFPRSHVEISASFAPQADQGAQGNSSRDQGLSIAYPSGEAFTCRVPFGTAFTLHTSRRIPFKSRLDSSHDPYFAELGSGCDLEDLAWACPPLSETEPERTIQLDLRLRDPVVMAKLRLPDGKPCANQTIAIQFGPRSHAKLRTRSDGSLTLFLANRTKTCGDLTLLSNFENRPLRAHLDWSHASTHREIDLGWIELREESVSLEGWVLTPSGQTASNCLLELLELDYEGNAGRKWQMEADGKGRFHLNEELDHYSRVQVTLRRAYSSVDGISLLTEAAVFPAGTKDALVQLTTASQLKGSLATYDDSRWEVCLVDQRGKTLRTPMREDQTFWFDQLAPGFVDLYVVRPGGRAPFASVLNVAVGPGRSADPRLRKLHLATETSGSF